MAGGVQPTGAFDVVVSLAAGRIAFAAADSKRLYKPFAARDVTDQMRDMSKLFVTAIPRAPTRSTKTIDVPSPIERIVLKSKTSAGAVAQPTDMAFEPVEWSNLLGGKVQGNTGWATFALDDVREFPAGDFDVVLVTQAGERRCKVGANDRKKLFGQGR